MIKDKFVVDLYIRVSTDRQAREGDSLEEQENELKKFCDYRNYQIHKIYIERGRSGGNTNRPEYQKLISDVKNRKVNAVIVKKLDRLSRSLIDFEQLMIIFKDHNVEFISLKENFDTTSAMGKAMLRVALVFAQLEREQTSERLVDVLDFRASQGIYNGGIPPFGYTNINKELVPYPKEKQLVELIYKSFLENKSTTYTAKMLNESGFKYRNNKNWYVQQIQRILQNPVYIGKMAWKGKLYQGIHQPIITEKTFRRAEEVFKSKVQSRPDSKTKAMFQRLIFCGDCGSPLTTTFAVNRHKKKYFYYKCTGSNKTDKTKCNIKYVSIDKTEKTIIDLLLSFTTENLFSKAENKILKHNQKLDQEIELINKQIHLTELQLNKIQAKKDKYFDSLITGNFSSSEREKINRYIDEMELKEKQVKSELFKLEFNKNQFSEDLINTTQIKQVFISFKTDINSFSKEELKNNVQNLIERIIYYNDSVKIKFKLLPWELDFDIN